jgi:hypothetical protein
MQGWACWLNGCVEVPLISSHALQRVDPRLLPACCRDQQFAQKGETPK